MNAEQVIAQLGVELANTANDRDQLRDQVVQLQARVAELEVALADAKAATNGKASRARSGART